MSIIDTASKNLGIKQANDKAMSQQAFTAGMQNGVSQVNDVANKAYYTGINHGLASLVYQNNATPNTNSNSYTYTNGYSGVAPNYELMKG